LGKKAGKTGDQQLQLDIGDESFNVSNCVASDRKVRIASPGSGAEKEKKISIQAM